MLNRTWRPALAVTGADGLPPLANAGNVLRPQTTLKLSLRLPPHVDADAATRALKALLESDPPYGAKVTFDGRDRRAPAGTRRRLAPWLEGARRGVAALLRQAGDVHGRGRHDPVHGHARREVPAGAVPITGVLGPRSNAHGPNEFLHLPTARKLTCCVAQVVHEHSQRAPARPAKKN